jgi:signal transduction histidine kinase
MRAARINLSTDAGRGPQSYAHLVREQDPARIFLPRFVPQWLVDIAPVLAILVVGSLIIGIRGDGEDAKRAEFFLYLFVAGVPLVFRRFWPVELLAWTIVVAVVTGFGPAYALPLLFALFNVAAMRGWRLGLPAAALVLAAQIVAIKIHDSPALGFQQLVSRTVATGLALAAGLYVYTRHAYVEGLKDRAARAERERELLASQAVAEERVRIARELHDVVAHNVSLMVVQAQAVGAVADDEGQRGALDQIAALGRQGLAEMHRMLDVLRPGEEEPEAELEPQPGVADVERLVEHARGAGLEVQLSVEGEARTLPPGVDLSAYRIVQEALTNVVRHAGDARATVTIRYGAAGLELDVVDDGRGPSSNGHGGHGLVGMRERVALFDGELTAGPGPGGRGYAVRALLPFSE